MATCLCGLPGKFGFGKVKSGKYPRESNRRTEQSEGRHIIVSRGGKVFMDWNFGNYKVEWKVGLNWQQRKFVANGMSRNGGGGRPTRREFYGNFYHT